MNVRRAYDAWSNRYDNDRNLTRDLDAAVTRKTLSGLRPKNVLELGCGTGKNTVFLAKIAPSVLALDFSEGMLAQAREKVRSPRVSFKLADLTKRWPAPSNSFELVTANLVLEHIEDLRRVFKEAARVLRPGGRFFVSELHPFRQYDGKKAEFRGARGMIQVPAFIHELSEFTDAAFAADFTIEKFAEHRHGTDGRKLPRLVSFLFRQPR